MYWYLGGLATLSGAYIVFRQGLGPGDNKSALLGLKAFGKLSIVVCFFWGFFVYAWWVPIAGILCSMPLWFVIQVIALKMTFSMLIALRSQLGMIIGTVMSVYGLINP
jgi:hypothetical protein